MERENKTDVQMFENILMNMLNTYKAKNHDYGNSVTALFNEFGEVSIAVRLSDKVTRYKTLIKSEAQVKDESKIDTLLDLAVYSIMGIIELSRGDSIEEEKRRKLY